MRNLGTIRILAIHLFSYSFMAWYSQALFPVTNVAFVNAGKFFTRILYFIVGKICYSQINFIRCIVNFITEGAIKLLILACYLLQVVVIIIAKCTFSYICTHYPVPLLSCWESHLFYSHASSFGRTRYNCKYCTFL